MRGQTLETFLDGLGIREEVYAVAAKRALVLQMTDVMGEQKLTKQKMAAKMATSRTQLDRLLDPENDCVQLDTIMKAAAALGKTIRIELVDIDQAAGVPAPA